MCYWQVFPSSGRLKSHTNKLKYQTTKGGEATAHAHQSCGKWKYYLPLSFVQKVFNKNGAFYRLFRSWFSWIIEAHASDRPGQSVVGYDVPVAWLVMMFLSPDRLWCPCCLTGYDVPVAWLVMMFLLPDWLWCSCCLIGYDVPVLWLVMMFLSPDWLWCSCRLIGYDVPVAWLVMMFLFSDWLWCPCCLIRYDVPVAWLVMMFLLPD